MRLWVVGSLLPLTFPSWTDNELQGSVHRSQRCSQTQSRDIFNNNCSRSFIVVPQMFIRNNHSALKNTNSTFSGDLEKQSRSRPAETRAMWSTCARVWPWRALLYPLSQPVSCNGIHPCHLWSLSKDMHKFQVKDQQVFESKHVFHQQKRIAITLLELSGSGGVCSLCVSVTGRRFSGA